MVYEAYQRRIARIAKILNFIRRHTVPIVTTMVVAAVATVGFFSVRGIMLQDVTCSAPTYLYGEIPELEAEALFSDITYEFAPVGSEDWSADYPLLPGEYQVRAVSLRGLNGNGYSQTAVFTVLPRELTVRSANTSVVYGKQPTPAGDGLKEGDRICALSFDFYHLEDAKAVTTLPDLDTLRIENADGIDVTAAYAVTAEETDITLTPAPVTIAVEGGSKTYDGTPLTVAEWQFGENTVVKGDMAEVVIDASITEPGSAPNLPSSVRFWKGELDVTGYYELTLTMGNLTVSEREITVSTADASKIYDGTVLTVEEAAVSEGSLVETQALERVTQTDIVNVWESGENREEYRVVDADGNDVSHCYRIRYAYGALTVTPKEATLTSPTVDEHIYNGQFPSFGAEDVTVEGILPEHVDAIRYAWTVPEHADVGEYDNAFSILSMTVNGMDMLPNYSVSTVFGKVTVVPYELALSVKDSPVQKEYNAQTRTHTYAVGAKDGYELPDGYTVSVGFGRTESADVGEYTLSYDRGSLTIFDGARDVTGNFIILWEESTSQILEIVKASVTVSSGSAEKDYDREALTNHDTFYDGFLYEGHRIVLTSPSSQTDVGFCDNAFSAEDVKILDADDRDVTHNYEIAVGTFGTLTVHKRRVSFTADDVSKIYDGTAYEPNDGDVRLTLGELLEGDDFRVIWDEEGIGAIVNVWESDGADEYRFRIEIDMANGESFADCYEIVCVAGDITITKRMLTVTSPTVEEHVYDGLFPSFTADDMTVEGILEEHRDAMRYTWLAPEYADVGRYDNAFVLHDILIGDVDMLNNYELSTVYGTVTIVPRQIALEVLEGRKETTYNAQTQTYSFVASLKDGYALVPGHSLTVFFLDTESADVGEYWLEYDRNSLQIMDGKRDVTGNYTILWEESTSQILEIVKADVTVSSCNAEKEYDREALICNDTVHKGFLYEGHTIVLTSPTTPVLPNAHLGGCDNAFDVQHVRIVEIDSGRDVTHNYEISVGSFGILTIYKRSVVFESADQSKVYDAEAYVPNDGHVRLTGGTLLSGDEWSVVWRPEAQGIIHTWDTAGGNYAFDIVITMSGNEEHFTDYYEISYSYGTITVDPRPVTFVSGGDTFVYDAEGHRVPTIVSTEGLLSWHTYTAEGFEEFINVRYNEDGEVIPYENVFYLLYDVIWDSELSMNVRNDYEISYEYGEILIQRRRVTFTSDKYKNEYNGLVQSGYEGQVTVSDELLTDHGHDYLVEMVSQYADAALYPNGNEFYVLMIYVLGESHDVTANYEIVYEYGDFEITKRKIALTSESDDKIYDGLPFSPLGVSANRLVDGHWLDYISYADSVGPNVTAPDVNGNHTFKLLAIYDGERDVTANYQIVSEICGTLVIEKRIVVLGSYSQIKEYDSYPLISEPWDQSNEENTGLLDSHTVTPKDPASYTAIGVWPGGFTEVDIYNGKENVTGNYQVILGEFGDLEITKRQIAVQTGTLSDVYYDGQAHTQETFEIIQGSLLTHLGHKLRPEGWSSIVNVWEGPMDNDFVTAVFLDRNGNLPTDANGTPIYELVHKELGTLSLQKRPVTVRSDSASKVYDGKYLSAPNVTLVSGLGDAAALADGHRWVSLFTPEALEGIWKAGTIINEFDGFVADADGVEIPRWEENYEIALEFGELTISKYQISVQTDSATKRYDGTPLTAPGWSFAENVFPVEGDSLTLNVIGSQTEVGSSENGVNVKNPLYAVRVVDGEEFDVSDCYELVEAQFGTLTVLKGKLVIVSYSASKNYDGTALTDTRYEYYGLAPDDELTITVYGQQTAVGSSENRYTVMLNGGEDIEKNYIPEYRYGVLTVFAEGEPFEAPEKPIIPTDDELFGEAVIGGTEEGNLGSISDSENGSHSGMVGEPIEGGSKDGGNLDESGSIDTESGESDLAKDSQTVAMYLTADTNATVYLRYMSFGNYDPVNGWSPAIVYESATLATNPLYLAARKLTQMALAEHYLKITLEGDQYMLPYYATNAPTEYLSDVLIDSPEREYVLNFISFDFEYLWEKHRQELTAEFQDAKLASLENAYAMFVRQNYLDVPESTREVLSYIAGQHGWSYGNLDSVMEIVQYIRNAAAYAEHEPCEECGDTVVCFLTHNNTGVCRHFASAATLMFRTVGIPARYTTGYAANVRANQTVSVLGEQAHAWVEIYIDNLGWVALEVTGSAELPPEPSPLPPPEDIEPEEPPVTESYGTVQLYYGEVSTVYNGREQYYDTDMVYVGLPEGYGHYTYRLTCLRGWTDARFGEDAIEYSVGDGLRLYIYDENGNDVTHFFNIEAMIDPTTGEPSVGKLHIQRSVIVIRTDGKTASKASGINTLTHASYSIVNDTMPDGYTFRPLTWTSLASVGSVANEILDWGVYTMGSDGIEKNVWKNFDLQYQSKGLLTLTS